MFPYDFIQSPVEEEMTFESNNILSGNLATVYVDLEADCLILLLVSSSRIFFMSLRVGTYVSAFEGLLPIKTVYITLFYIIIVYYD